MEHQGDGVGRFPAAVQARHLTSKDAHVTPELLPDAVVQDKGTGPRVSVVGALNICRILGRSGPRRGAAERAGQYSPHDEMGCPVDEVEKLSLASTMIPAGSRTRIPRQRG